MLFEHHVAAYWLAQLLVRSIPPILIDTGVTEVHFQTEQLGYNTDDFLVVCARAGAASARLVGQVKRSFTISAADDECKKAIGDFWKDFKNADPFNPQHDRFVLVTLRGTNTLLDNFVGLLDCARGAADGGEFQRRRVPTAESSNGGSPSTGSLRRNPSTNATNSAGSSAHWKERTSLPETCGLSCVCSTF